MPQTLCERYRHHLTGQMLDGLWWHEKQIIQVTWFSRRAWTVRSPVAASSSREPHRECSLAKTSPPDKQMDLYHSYYIYCYFFPFFLPMCQFLMYIADLTIFLCFSLFPSLFHSFCLVFFQACLFLVRHMLFSNEQFVLYILRCLDPKLVLSLSLTHSLPSVLYVQAVVIHCIEQVTL